MLFLFTLSCLQLKVQLTIICNQKLPKQVVEHTEGNDDEDEEEEEDDDNWGKKYESDSDDSDSDDD